MKKIIYIILIAMTLISILFFALSGLKSEEKHFKNIELNTQKNTVQNFTSNKFYDTIVYVGLEQMGFEGIDITISPLSQKAQENFESTGNDLSAHLRELDGKYYLFISTSDEIESIPIIAHELIHLSQYHTKRLIYSEGTIYWEGKPYILNEINYDKRPWEDEAYELQLDLSNKIQSVLF